ELAECRDQHQELGDSLEVEVARLAEVVNVGDHDLPERHLRQRDLLAQQDREQQVERPLEDVEVEIELGDRGHARNSRGRQGGFRYAGPTPMAERTSARVADAIARAFSAPALRAFSSAASSGRS